MTRGHHPTPYPASTTQPGWRPEEEYSALVTRYRKLFLVRGKAYHTLLSPGQQNRQSQAQLAERKRTPAPGATACSSQPPQLRAVKGQAGRVSCCRSWRVMDLLPAGSPIPLQVAPEHSPTCDLKRAPPQREPLFNFSSSPSGLWHSVGIRLSFQGSVAESIWYLWGTIQ